ncbi:MAG: MFS transporter [Candidatus Zixiibacteriota bacterium]
MVRQFIGFDKRIYLLGFGWLVTSIGFAMVIPFLSIYFHTELGMSMSAIGLFFGVTAVLRAVPQPMAGWLSDRFGRVRIMGWSQVLRSFTFAGVAYAMAQNAGFWVIGSIIGLNYIFGAVLHPAANAMVADIVAKEERIPAYAFLRITGNLGWAIGPAMGGFIAHVSYARLFFISALLAVFSGLVFLVLLKDVKSEKPVDVHAFKIKDIFNLSKDPLLFRHCLISLLLFLAVAQFIAPFSVYVTDNLNITKSQLGGIYFINGFMVVVLQFFMSALFRNWKLTNQLILGAINYAIVYFCLVFAGSYSHLIIFMVVMTLGEMIVSPPSVTIVANLSPPTAYGRYMGVFGLFQMAGWSLGPTVGGILLDLFDHNPSHSWFVISGMALIAAALFYNLGRKLSPDVNSGLKAQV